MKEGEYIIANVTIRGQCKEGRRYKIHGVIEKGHKEIDFFGLGIDIEYDEEAYYLMHNGRMTISNSSNFKYDYHHNRKLKIKKIKEKYDIKNCK